MSFMCRGHYPSADEYLNHAEKSDTTLVEAFKRMQVIEEEEPVEALDENGEPDEEVMETEENVDEAVQVDTDQPEETVLVNGNEGEEQWGTNNEGTSPA
ncbi:hypothetical protein ACQJBY_071675 [Aegilops geniculata]|uniref:Uncharacterized protein n=1 Tax=Triticum turgidum subsp. durum TaxID=4567 RepID=A0A9R0Z4L3_TRITD|nr:unnamed protein product [Triticum turgidum subsp. durum]